jgi:Zn-dependent M28 family amino/carboxypeptidase
MMNRSFLLLACFLALACCLLNVAAQQVDIKKLDADLKSDLGWAPCKNSDRFEGVKDLFRQHGASDTDMRVDKYKDLQNLVLSKRGKTDEIVIVGAHYDKVNVGCGVLDNWSGISILATLYEELSKKETQKSYVFVAFDQEEIGLKGSEAMVKGIPKADRQKYCSMVNLDSFGLGYIVILESASSSKMINAATEVGTRLKMPVSTIKIPGADADSSSFKRNNIPAITLSALSDKWPLVMHTSKDRLENILVGSVRVGYIFTLAYLKDVDAAGCAAYK